MMGYDIAKSAYWVSLESERSIFGMCDNGVGIGFFAIPSCAVTHDSQFLSNNVLYCMIMSSCYSIEMMEYYIIQTTSGEGVSDVL